MCIYAEIASLKWKWLLFGSALQNTDLMAWLLIKDLLVVGWGFIKQALPLTLHHTSAIAVNPYSPAVPWRGLRPFLPLDPDLEYSVMRSVIKELRVSGHWRVWSFNSNTLHEDRVWENIGCVSIIHDNKKKWLSSHFYWKYISWLDSQKVILQLSFVKCEEI